MIRVWKTIALLMVLMLCTAAGANAGQDLLEKIKKDGKIVIGTTLAAPPFAYRNDKGEPEGLEIDLMNKLGEYMGVEVEVADMAWGGLIPALLSGRIDIIGARMSATMERATKVVFAHPWLMTGTFAVAKDSRFKTWEDLNKPGIKVCAIAGAIGAAVAKAKLPKATLVTFELDGDQLKALKDGRVDAALNDELIVMGFTQKIDGAKVLEGNMQPDAYAYAARPDFASYRMKNWLDLYFATIMRSGEYNEIYKKWLGKDWEPGWNMHP